MNKLLQGTVNLPGSKSESNRALMIAAYGGFPLEVGNLSEARDTKLLSQLLEQVEHQNPTDSFVVDCEDAGTVARFMMTYLAGKPGHWVLTGTDRLCQRPMAPLIDALRQLGADINSIDVPGRLPVRIHGTKLHGGHVHLDASLSSQFVSSLLLAAPTWKEGLVIDLEGRQSSQPYIDMTLAIMRQFGAEASNEGNRLTVHSQPYRPFRFEVMADWSAASFWYEMMAISDGGTLLLNKLKPNSLQGDEAVVGMFAKLGVKTEFQERGVLLTKSSISALSSSKSIDFDFINTPDLFPSVFTACVALSINAIFYHISLLYNKESDRINSLITELSKIYTFINIVYDDKIIIEKSLLKLNSFDSKQVLFNTFQDHRIAMALAMLQPRFGWFEFNDPTVVNKSYPGFWEELKKFV